MVQLLIGRKGGDGGQWYQWLWGHVVGFELAWASLKFGEQTALLSSRWLQRAGRQAAARDKAKAAAQTSQENGHTGAQPEEWVAAKEHMPKTQTAEKVRRTQAWFTATTVAVLLFCGLFLALWIVLAIVDGKVPHSTRRSQWFALLFAPFGCTLRWQLSKLNTRDIKPLAWLPAGTFAANMTACIVDFVIGGLQNRYTFGYWALVITPAIRVGFSGALSTVSTFVSEVRFSDLTGVT